MTLPVSCGATPPGFPEWESHRLLAICRYWLAAGTIRGRHSKAGGCTRGVSAERFEIPLVGGAARLWRRGGNLPAPAFPPEGETGKGETQFLAAAGYYRYPKTDA